MTKPPLSDENAYNLDVINRHKILLFCFCYMMKRFWLTQRVFRGLRVLPTMAFTGKLRPKAVPFSGFKYMKGWGFPVADSGEGPGARPTPPPLFLDQNEARRAEKRFLGDRPPPLPPLLSQGLDPALISLVEVFKKVRKTVISVWKRPKRAIRCILLLTMKKSRKRFVVWFIYVWKTVPLQGMWKGYHLSIEGIRKRHLVSVKNSICKGTVLDLGAEPPRIKLFGVPPVDFPFHWLQWEDVIGWEFQSRRKEKIDLRSLFVTSRKSTFSGLNYIVIWVTWAVMELTLSTQGIHLALDFLTVTY